MSFSGHEGKPGPVGPESFLNYPLRTCRYLHHCCLCKETIEAGEKYYDAGYHNRAHDGCVAQAIAIETIHSNIRHNAVGLEGGETDHV